MTADEIRRLIIDISFANGGHLASSLGAVELSMALAQVFSPEVDRIVWDVGHQAYAWKILTGRADRFGTLRQLDGISPFPNPAESHADAAVAGHAGAALSVAAGLASARDRQGSGEHVVAVIGDGAMANGMTLEALNNIRSATGKLIVVLNDNGMGISKTTGAFGRQLARLLASVGYNRFKAAAESAGHRMHLTFLRGFYHRLESRIKGLFLANRFFEQFGLRYIGPVDGHNLNALVSALTVAREDKRSVLLHVVTCKGRGFEAAEHNPEKYHGIPAGGPKDTSQNSPATWSDVFGRLVSQTARTDARIVALTAGMTSGTGLKAFAAEFPGRFFNVGISEEHMVSFAAGLASGGMRPVVAVYSTFLQRSVDQVIHDVAISGLPVVFCVDRAGVVGSDGVTHQGVFDIALLKVVPGLAIWQPCDAREFATMFSAALKRSGPTVIRYPRGECPSSIEMLPEVPVDSLALQVAYADAKIQLWVAGDQLQKALAVAEKTGCGVVYARSLKPFDAELLRRQRSEGRLIVSLENGVVAGGFGESIGADLKFGWPDEFIPHGSPSELECRYHLDVNSIVSRLSGLSAH